MTSSRIATTTLTTEQRNTWRIVSRQLRPAGFQIRRHHLDGHRALIASNRRAGRSTLLILRIGRTAEPLITLSSATFSCPDGDRYFPLDQAAEAVTAAIETAWERVR